MAELEKRQQRRGCGKAPRRRQGPRQPPSSARPARSVLGNPQGDVTMVEFFDYNCAFCKRAMSDMLELLKNDPKLKVVLKEFPVLGRRLGAGRAGRGGGAHAGQDRQEISRLPPASCSAAAARPTRRARSRSPRRSASTWRGSTRTCRATRCKQTLDENLKLAEELGLNGTPSYVIGKDVVVGAVGLTALQGQGQHRALRQGDLLRPQPDGRNRVCARAVAPLGRARARSRRGRLLVRTAFPASPLRSGPL